MPRMANGNDRYPGETCKPSATRVGRRGRGREGVEMGGNVKDGLSECVVVPAEMAKEAMKKWNSG